MKPKSSDRQTVKSMLFIVLLLTALVPLYPRTYHVCQDGTGDYLTISLAVNSAQDGDTVIVHPGTYYENISFSDKDIVITSLYGIESYDRRYIKETIINGNSSGTVLTFGRLTEAILSGFTITNGYDLRYGGVFAHSLSTLTIKHCIIEYNHSSYLAGGIMSRGHIILIGNIVRYNTGGRYGGLFASSATTFCNDEPNSFYLNYGSYAADLALNGTGQPVLVFDTMTVRDSPDTFFISVPPDMVPPGFQIIINNAKMELVSADLHVSPDGCDSNSGLSPEEPLQRIATALMRIRPDRAERRTIHLAEGIYSPSLNDQWFPVGIRDFVDIKGHNKETTILSGDDNYTLFSPTPSIHNPVVENVFTVKNLTLTNAYNAAGYPHVAFGAMTIPRRENFTLKNLIITNNDTKGASRLVYFQYCDNITLKNIDINNNWTGISNSRLFSIFGMMNADVMYGENIRIHNNHAPYGGGRSTFKGTTLNPDSHHITLANFELTDNSNSGEQFFDYGRQVNVCANVRLVNATVAGNRVPNAHNPAAFMIDNYSGGYVLSVYNSIFYDNGSDYQILVSRHPNQEGQPDVINVNHSLIENGKDSIFSWHNYPFILNWGEGNIDKDPLFIGENDQGLPPYSLSERSPARGAGTLDIPDFEFPEYDIAGNPRIVDGQIDMGAYQYHEPTTSIEDEEREGVTERLRDGEFNLHNFPNPVTYLHSDRQAGQTRSSTGTTISFEAPESGEVVIEIYNVKGQFVRRVFDAYITKGEYNVFWDGKDERGRYVATGFYMYNLHFNDELVTTGRATFIK